MFESNHNSDYIETLFGKAWSAGREYLYTLLRVTGPELDRSDSLVKLRARLNGALSDREIIAEYRDWVGNEDVIDLIANLLNRVLGKPYSSLPFHHLDTGTFPQEVIRATSKQKIEELIRLASEAEMPELSSRIHEVYSLQIPNDNEGGVVGAATNARAFFIKLLEVYFSERLRVKNWNRFQKASAFEVMELLTNDEYGLYGFRMHFPTGATAFFERHPETHDGRNFSVPEISFFVGLIDQMQNAWSIEGKRLHELSLPGRYNRDGQWKPIAGPMAIEALSEEARSLSEDPDVQGCLFYTLSTGFRVIEFVVRANIDLPHEQVSFGNQLHLWKCPLSDDEMRSNNNFKLYDGWFEIESVDPDQIRHSLAMIDVALNRLAFAYDVHLSWRVKYRLELEQQPLWVPSKDDTHLINSLLKDFPQTDDAVVLDAALDWFRRGQASRNTFTAFLCYYIALESVALAVAEGEADLGLNYHRQDKTARKQERLSCIREKHDLLYDANPQEFVEEAYFDCVVGLAKRTRRVAELVFSAKNPNVELLFTKGIDGHSLSSIRSVLAHGKFVLLDADDRKIVRRRVREIARISKEFLTRIIFGLKPDDPLPTWSRKFSDTLHFADPRSTKFVNDE
jgi:hypothetical protein